MNSSYMTHERDTLTFNAAERKKTVSVHSESMPLTNARVVLIAR